VGEERKLDERGEVVSVCVRISVCACICVYVCVCVCVCVPGPLCSTGMLSLRCVRVAGSPPGGCPPVARCEMW
jgi:hypothetical protein